jgi:hypothetical protein
MAKTEVQRLDDEADALVQVQRDQRGWVPGPTVTIDNKPIKTLNVGTYDPTPENEARASRILSLRRRAGWLEWKEQHGATE